MFRCRLPAAQHDPRLDRLHANGIGHARDAHLFHGGMRRQHFLHLARPHLIAARLDEVLLAVDDEQVSIFVEIAEISRVQPSPRSTRFNVIAQRTCGLLRAIPESGHQLRGGKTNLAHLLRRQHARPFLVVEDAHLDVGKRHADGPDLVGTLHRVRAERHHRLRERVALDDSSSGELLEPLLGVGHQRRRARKTGLDRLEAHLARLNVVVVQKRDEERRHGWKERRPHALDRRDDVGHVTRVRYERKRARGNERHRLQAQVRVDVEKRKGRQHDILARLEHRREPCTDLEARQHVGGVLP